MAAVLWSLSKPFGVYYHRVGGLLTRAEVPALRGHHWFKNLFSLALGERLMATYAPGQLPAAYSAHQTRAIARAKDAGAVDPEARASDVVLLAHGPAADERFAEYRRGEGQRYCLSPAMDAAIAQAPPP
jgi:hypothetical protein